MNIRDIYGVASQAELYEIATIQFGLHAHTMDKLIEFAHEIQRRGFEERDRRELALNRLAQNAQELGLYDMEPKSE
jgi:hypothetical protein